MHRGWVGNFFAVLEAHILVTHVVADDKQDIRFFASAAMPLSEKQMEAATPTTTRLRCGSIRLQTDANGSKVQLFSASPGRDSTH